MRQLTRKQTKRLNEALWAGSNKFPFREKVPVGMRKVKLTKEGQRER